MRRYIPIFRASMQINLAYRAHFFFLMLGNAVYIVVTWFLWKSIYGGNEILNGMTFAETFTYLSVAMSVFVLLQTWVEWGMSQRIISGDIVIDFLRPLDYMAMTAFDILGFTAGNFLAITLPSLLLIVFVFGAPIPLGTNILFFLVALCFAFMISFLIDFMTGSIGFYTESTWGVSMTKEVIVLALSGAVVPIKFYPESFQRVLEWLPFQAIYNAPLRLLMDEGMTLLERLGIIGTQAVWTVLLFAAARAFLSRSSRAVTVNGG